MRYALLRLRRFIETNGRIDPMLVAAGWWM